MILFHIKISVEYIPFLLLISYPFVWSPDANVLFP